MDLSMQDARQKEHYPKGMPGRGLAFSHEVGFGKRIA